MFTDIQDSYWKVNTEGVSDMCAVKLGSYYRNLLAVILSTNYIHNLLGPNWICPTLTIQSSQNMLRAAESLADWLVHLYLTHSHDVCLQVGLKSHLLKMQPRTIMLVAVTAKLERHKGLSKLRLRGGEEPEAAVILLTKLFMGHSYLWPWGFGVFTGLEFCEFPGLLLWVLPIMGQRDRTQGIRNGQNNTA